ncbi:hypothetical protein D1AOALGA4SA_12542 [Olavius algarvensis Delta 1 endosymbiont]|nr:hypothetical protein D1AOALGA4SA_12542 [Olavius algarvensis Delta 1 endosymbiont]
MIVTIIKNGFAFDSTDNDMVQGTRGIYANFARHGYKLTCRL